MSHKDNMDLRNTGDGGWFYAEHELFSVFAPLIGPLGVSVYMAMCRLIPLAAVDPERQVTERAVMAAACVSKGTANRKMAEIVALGMVECSQTSNRRTPTYKLASLRNLALVGIAELNRRLGGPAGTTDKDRYPTDQELEGMAEGADPASMGGQTSKAAVGEAAKGAKAPAASGENGGPRWTTGRPAVETTLLDLLVVQKTASVVQKTPLVVHPEPFFKEEEEEDKYSPLPLSQAKGGLLPNLSASVVDGNHDKNKKTPHDAKGLAAAVAKVLRECSLSTPRLDRVIEAAMRLDAAKTDGPPNWNAVAESMVKSYAIWLQDQHLMAFKPGSRKFFHEYWNDQRKWPYDEKRVSERRRF
jgi:hypothetical protein